MLQRKCPKCQNGVMSEVDTFFGWGKESTYICDMCANTVYIRENSNMDIEYPIIAEVDNFELSEIQKKRLEEINTANKTTAKKVYISAAIFLILSYIIIVFTSIDENEKGYFFMALFTMFIPFILWIRRK